MYKPKAVLFDFDGTIYFNFLRDDRFIIEILFGTDNLVVNMLDMFLRKLNSYNIIPNNTTVLYIRLCMYAILCFEFPSGIIKQYRELYVAKAQMNLKAQYHRQLFRIEKYATVIIVSNNLFSTKLCNISFKNGRFITTRNKKKTIAEISKDYEVVALVGDNYFDDICSGYAKSLTTIYVGKNKFIAKSHKTDYSACNFSMAVSLVMYLLTGDKNVIDKTG